MEQLKRSRAGLKSRVTFMKRELLEAMASEKKASLVEDMERSLTDYMNKANDIQEKMEQLLTDEDQLTEELSSWISKEDTRTLKSDINSKANAASEPLLPKWSLPKFGGNLLEFTSFWDQFEASVHCRQELSDVTKLVYLRSALTDNALKAVEGFSMTNANYAMVVEVLKGRFGRPHAIVEAHIKGLLGIWKCGDFVKTSELREFHDKLNLHVRALAALGHNPCTDELSAADILLTMFKKKLPETLQKTWENKIMGESEESVTLESFLEFLQGQAEIEECVMIPEKRSGEFKAKVEKTEPRRRQRRDWPSSAAALQATVSQEDGCAFCSGNHNNDQCRRFNDLQVKGRWKMVRERRVCFSCLSKGYQMNDCSRRHEGHQYHPLLSTERRERKEVLSGVNDVHVALANVPTNRKVLLQTAQAVMRNKDGDRTVITCLLDAGSQRSFVTT
uniref:Peptidase aspartic putative domain-containing protein n=1 Tax=Trichuris muris TaxID=70415 RepID=A0A5S6QY52_TRIMR